MSLCSDGTTDESESSEEEELVTWRFQKSTKHGPHVCFRPEVVVEQPNKHRKQIGIQNNLSFKFVRSGTSLIRNMFTSYGFKECRETSNDFNVMWLNSHVKPYSLRNLMDFQRVNHFPRSYELTRKNLLAKNVERMAQTKNAKLFDFVAKSYMMPGQYQDFCHAAAREKGPWIVKPQASSRGRGIFLINSPSQVPLDDNTMVCRYIHNPLLIDGFKFDIRLYVAVSCYDPLIIYLYEEGMARFATIKYETSLKSIKNQWMHLTNYSINKKNPEFVRCEDPEQEDFGNKWTLGALLRYLREDGIDTSALMSRIEQVLIKTIISVEGQIGQACKTFMPFRGNCCELYGFDVLIDDTLKPWVLEVNLSPSLATDAPLDMKLKSHVVADFFNLMGVEAVDPLSRRSKDARISHAYNLGRSGKSPSPQTFDAALLSPEDVKLLKWVTDQNERRGGYIRIFPRADTWTNYGALLENKTHTNELLASRLFKETYRPYSSVVRNKFTEKTESNRFNRYEKRLDPLDKKKRRKKKKKKTTQAQVDADDYEDEDCGYIHNIEPISISGNKAPIPSGDAKAENKKIIKLPKKSIENSEIYKSIKEARDKKSSQPSSIFSPRPPEDSKKDPILDITSIEDLPDSINVSQMEQVTKKILSEAGKLSQIEAREAFVTYLRRVQLRFANAHEAMTSHNQITQMELVCRFLRKASSNLQNPLDITVPSNDSGIPIVQRKRILADLLTEFIGRYQSDTDIMMTDNPIFSEVVERSLFIKFCTNCKESEVEEILTKYTTENKSASVFLGTKKRTREKRKDESPVVKIEEENEILQPQIIESPYNHATTHQRGRQDFSLTKDRNKLRSTSQESKLLKRDQQTNPAYPSSCRDAAYIYSQKPRPPIVPRTDFVTVQNPLLPSRGGPSPHTMGTTSSEAIKLALKGLDRHNSAAEHRTVTELAKQLAKVKLNQNVKRRPNSAIVVQRHQRYTAARPYSTSDGNSASDIFKIPGRTKPRPYSATTNFVPQDPLIPKPPPKPCWR